MYIFGNVLLLSLKTRLVDKWNTKTGKEKELQILLNEQSAIRVSCFVSRDLLQFENKLRYLIC